MGDSPSNLIITTRGGLTENRHAIHAAITDSSGRLLHSVGDPSRVTLARSAAKPAQALAILESGAFDRFAFSDADLALVCSSHSSEARHVARARAMLARIGGGACESDLRCGGGHVALSDGVNRAWIKADFVPGPLCNNCSGKHVGMLAGAKALMLSDGDGAGADDDGWAAADYHQPAHPMQQRVKACVADLCGLPADEVAWATDGCNLPAPACPLRCLARSYAVVARAADAVRGEDPEAVSSDRMKALARIYDAMVEYPEMVAGEGRFCTVLMEAFGGSVVGKLGADACYGVGVRASEQTGALGIAVKIEDGNEEMLYAAVAEILEQLRIGTVDMRRKLAAFHHPKRVNTALVVTGEVSMQFKVRAVSGG